MPLITMSTDIKLKKAQLSKITQSGGFICKTWSNMMSNLGKKTLIYLAIPLTKDVLLKLATKPTSPVLYKFFKKSGREAVRAGKLFTLFISNEDMNGIIKIV